MYQPVGILGGLALAAALVLPGNRPEPSAAPGEAAYVVDGLHSSVLFSVVHLGAARFYGRFNEVGGEIEFDPDRPEEARIRVEIAAGSIDTNSEKRDQHLRGPDFFSSKEFEKLTFESTSAKVAREKGAGGSLALEVTGELEIAGRKREITVLAEQVGAGKGRGGAELIGFHSRFTIQRSDFGVDYMPGGLSEEVEVIISLEAAR